MHWKFYEFITCAMFKGEGADIDRSNNLNKNRFNHNIAMCPFVSNDLVVKFFLLYYQFSPK